MADGDVALDSRIALHPRDPQMLDRKEAFSRRHKTWDEHIGTGAAMGSHEALSRAQSLMTLCGRSGCHALVKLTAVGRIAKSVRDGRVSREAGCAARYCTRQHKPKRFRENQHRWIAELRSGDRMLVERPATWTQEWSTRISGAKLDAVLKAALL